jgi:hypothetical protein
MYLASRPTQRQSRGGLRVARFASAAELPLLASQPSGLSGEAGGPGLGSIPVKSPGLTATTHANRPP